ncbi:MAG: group II intron reverse transcriptase/maturase [Verrucomicrobiales bacterium]
MKDRTKQEPNDPAPGSEPANASRHRASSTACGGKHGEAQAGTETWLEQVLEAANMHRAWQRVRRNQGAPGVDGMTIDTFPAFARKHWEQIASQLRKGTYRPAAVRRVFIPKPDGTERPLGIPTVLDRVIQQAIAQVLTPLYDGEFSDQSYGFREGRNAHQAVRQVEAAWKQRRRHAVDCDLKAFFDTVNHDRLLNQLREKVGNSILLRLIGRYLRAGVELPDGTREATPQGVPQGGPLSPLLANIVLDPLDKELERRGHVHVRYADDFIILVKSAKAAQRVMESVTGYVENKLKLVVNRTKSRSVPLIQSSFLGFQISSRGKVKWTEKAFRRFKQRVKEITRRNRGHATEAVIDELRRYANGWMSYFGISHTYREVLELDEWIRRRVRLYHWKQWKVPRARRRNLIKLGISPAEVHKASRSRKGYWRMSQNSLVRFALNNRVLQEKGVPELRSVWIKLHYGERAKAWST